MDICPYPDQDIMNYCFSENYLKLPPNISWRVGIIKTTNKINKTIYHYCGPGGKFSLDKNDIFSQLYFEYFAKTPWFNSKIFANIYKSIDQLLIQSQIKLINLCSLISQRQRIFLIENLNTEEMKKIFSISAEEILIQVKESNDLNKITDEFKRSNNKKICMIISPNYLVIRNVLISAGLTEGFDFVNLVEFFPNLFQIPFDTFPIIKSM